MLRMDDEKALVPNPPLSGRRERLVTIAVVAFAIAAGYWLLGDILSLEELAKHESELRQFQRNHPQLVFGIAFVIYVIVTGLSLPGATVLSLVYGWFFGWIPGVVLVSFASTTGATFAFLLSRYLFRDFVQRRYGEALATVHNNFARDGAFYLFTLRLIPAVPFFVINIVMGLTSMKVRTFWWVSQIGMLAGTVVYLYAGSTVPSLQQLASEGIGAVFSAAQLTHMMVAFAAIGLLPLAARKLLNVLSE